MKVRRPGSKFMRGAYASIAAAFWFFLVASAPHRVHHFFEQVSASQKNHGAHIQSHEHADGKQHGDDDHHHRQPAQPKDCTVLSVAQNAHASLVQSFHFAVLECTVARDRDLPVATASSFNPAPLSQRAPPLV
jgi:hypothetical protein